MDAQRPGECHAAYPAEPAGGHTGIRIEEPLEITYRSFIADILPTTGEVVLILQVALSRPSGDRLLLVSPDLGEILTAIYRVRAGRPPAAGDRRLRRL